MRLDKTVTQGGQSSQPSATTPDTSISTSLNSLGVVDSLAQVPAGNDPRQHHAQLLAVPDGLSNTLIVAEDAEANRFRTRGRPSGLQRGVDRPGQRIRHRWLYPRRHNPGPCPSTLPTTTRFTACRGRRLFADGSVHFLADTLDIRVVAKLITAAANDAAVKFD
jgi:hypothetical protein